MITNRLHWCLIGSGKFDTRSFCQEIRGATISPFPFKGTWKVKVPKKVAFFMWTIALCWILTLDSLTRRRLPLMNWCCMCRSTRELVDHLLLHCDVAHAL